MAITLDRGEGIPAIRLEGEVDIRSALELKQTLTDALAFGKGVQLHLERVTELDITAIQLLWAARREAKKKGVAFIIVTPLSEGLVANLREAGFEELLPSATPSSLQATALPAEEKQHAD